MTHSIDSIRKEFPILDRKVKGKPLVYLDNAASTQKPQVVIDAIQDFYQNYNANVHRGIHSLSEEGTLAMEGSRDYIAQYLGAKRTEVIFTKGTTESLNLLAFSLGFWLFKPDDEILITSLEHHANIVPWQLACERHGLKLRIVAIDDDGNLDLDSYRSQLSERTKLVSFCHTSNALGIKNPVDTLIKEAKSVGALTVIDAAQTMGHQAVNVKDLSCDFLVFSSHKLYGPTGVGILYGREELLEKMPPYQSGGEMISEVRFDKSTFNELPYKFEAGTPHIAGNIVLKTAIEWFSSISSDWLASHEQAMLTKAQDGLRSIEGLRIIGDVVNKTSIVSFVIEGVHHQDLALMLDSHGIAVRTGHHCTQPLMNRLGISGTTRASFSVYNSLEEVDFFIEKTRHTVALLR
mgnify:CR=1 FL=1